MSGADKPTDWTFAQYRATVESHAETVIENLTSYPDDYEEPHHAVRQVVENAHAVTYPGWSLMTVLLSEQDPDDPEYWASWRELLDLDAGPSWSEIIRQMAYVCLYSDVYDHAARCPDCRGMGDFYPDDGGPKQDCETCGGSGRRDLEQLRTEALRALEREAGL